MQVGLELAEKKTDIDKLNTTGRLAYCARVVKQ